MNGKDRWSHGFSDWVWVDDLGCWFHGRDYSAYWCLGDRMFHEAYGSEEEGGVCFHGSYSNDWHGGIQTYDFDEAMAWLHEANGTDNWWWSK